MVTTSGIIRELFPSSVPPLYFHSAYSFYDDDVDMTFASGLRSNRIIWSDVSRVSVSYGDVEAELLGGYVENKLEEVN